MQSNDIKRDIIAFLTERFLFGHVDQIDGDASLLGGVVDSTGAIEFVLFLQERFGVTLDDEDLFVPENFDSVNSAVRLISLKLGRSA